jgi:hypothetical protein
MNFREWLRRVTGLTINIVFNGPTMLNFGRGKHGKDRRIPTLLGAAPQAQRRRPLLINLAPSRRERLLEAPANPHTRATWAQTMRDLSQTRKHL